MMKNQTADDIAWLRTAFRGTDPAVHVVGDREAPATGDQGALLLADEPQLRSGRPGTRRGSFLLAAAVAAAVVAASVAIPLATGGEAGQEPAASQPGAVASFHHVQWKDYTAGTFEGTTDRWWNGQTGRTLTVNAQGVVLRDVDLTLPTPGAAGYEGAVAAPTTGSEATADDFPGPVPDTPDQLRAYLAPDGDDGAVASRIASLLIQRHLDDTQTAALMMIVNDLSDAGGGLMETTAPDGQAVTVKTVADSVGLIGLVMDPGGTHLIGYTYDTNPKSWRIITRTNVSPTAG